MSRRKGPRLEQEGHEAMRNAKEIEERARALAKYVEPVPSPEAGVRSLAGLLADLAAAVAGASRISEHPSDHEAALRRAMDERDRASLERDLARDLIRKLEADREAEVARVVVERDLARELARKAEARVAELRARIERFEAKEREHEAAMREGFRVLSRSASE